MTRATTRVLLAAALTALPACAQLPRGERGVFGTRPPAADPLVARHIALVADGAGDYRACSRELRRAARDDGWPLDVNTFVWSHGYMRNLADHTDHANIRARAHELAAQVTDLQRARPDMPVSLVGHSTGSAVVLAAAEELPAGSLDRIVLLAPAVSYDYDLRPALKSVRGGINVFYSREDRFWLGVVPVVLGTADDRMESRAAGRVGFKPEVQPGEEILYSKLTQYEWNPTVEQVGNDGGHFGAYAQGHLKMFVLPLFQY
ncbi:MAG: alpha/beta hydrolase [Gemmataceae bacterium]